MSANPLVLGSASDMLLATTVATTVLSVTATGNLGVFVYVRILATTGLTVTVAWTDATGAQTHVALVGTQRTGAYSLAPYYLNNASGTVTVTATAGIGNAASVSASVKRA